LYSVFSAKLLLHNNLSYQLLGGTSSHNRVSILTANTPEKRIRILVVDDEADIRTVITKGLAAQGFIVDSRGDPIQALDDFKPGAYDLVLLDIRMPKMNGFELFRAIQKLDPKVRVCFITAFEIYLDEFKKVFPKIHVSCFIRKPVTVKQLAEAIRAELTRPELESEGESAQVKTRHVK
jgi:DNA-binding response OmpR family regulator